MIKQEEALFGTIAPESYAYFEPLYPSVFQMILTTYTLMLN